VRKPTEFGKYFLLQRINVGGMAEVFRAKTLGVEGFQKVLAIKRILPNIAEDEEFTTMFIDEAKIAVQLNHANIAQIFDLGKISDSYFIALEYVHGKDLRAIFDRLREKNARFSAQQAAFIASKIAEGLDYAHNKRDVHGKPLNIVHRDVSPQNVLISYEGEIKIVDFGIAKAASKASKTQAGILKGKFGYMSPEQVRGLSLDRRSDVFAIGIILYELLTGERLFKGESDYSTLEKVRNVEMVPPTSLVPQIPAELERIVLKTLTKEREERYQTAREILDDLNRFLFSFESVFSREDLAALMYRHFGEEIRIETEQMKTELERETPAARQRAVKPTSRLGGGRPVVAKKPSSARVKSGSASAPVRRGAGDRRRGGGRAVAPVRSATRSDTAVSPDEEGSTTRRLGASPSGGYSDLPPLDDQDGPTQVGDGAVTGVGASSLPPLELRDDSTGAGELFIPMRAQKRPPLLLIGAGVGAVLVAVLVFWLLSLVPGGGGEPVITPLVITSEPADVTVLLNGDRVADLTPFRTDVPPGKYVLAIEKRGYRKYETAVEVLSGEAKVVEAKLEKLREANASLVFRSRPRGASIYLDGVRLDGVTPHTERKVLSGEHKVRVALDGYQEEVRSILLKERQTKRVSLTLQRLRAILKVSSRPEGAAVRLDGRDTGRITPAVFDSLAARSKVKVMLRKQGYRDWWRRIEFDGFDEKMVNPRLELEPEGARPKPPPPPPPPPRRRGGRKTARRASPPPPPAAKPAGPPATVNLSVSKGWANIFIDGKKYGHTPKLGIKLPPGTHHIRLEDPKDSSKARVFRIKVKSGETKTFIKEPP